MTTTVPSVPGIATATADAAAEGDRSSAGAGPPAVLPTLTVVIDGGTDSARVLAVACALAERSQASLELAATVHDTAEREAASAALQSLAIEAGLPVVAARVAENVPEMIVDCAGRRPIGVVMWAQNPDRVAAERSLITDVLVSGTPVIAVGPHVIAHEPDLPVLACVGGAAGWWEIGPVAATWAAALRVRLDLMAVARPPVPDPRFFADGVVLPRDEAESALREAAAHIAEMHPDLEVRCHVATYPFDVVDAIDRFARRHRPQLIAVSRRIDEHAHLLHRSVAGRLVHQADTPVLMVPVSTPAEAMS